MAQVANYVESNTSIGKLNCPFLCICNGGNFIFWQLPDTQVNLIFEMHMAKEYVSFARYLTLFERPILSYLGVKCVRLRLIKCTHQYVAISKW